ncbi:MAG: hypothetical protein JSR80_04650 [Verrucomicrobia bacterium]|nr:hypothetical protein [Verrucomicrobiota bacterium]
MVPIKHPINSAANMEENFRAVIALLEKEGIMSEKYFDAFMPSGEGVKVVRHKKTIKGETVKAVFETSLETQEVTLKNAWVE